MGKDQIINFLERYDFKYAVHANHVTVNLDFAHKVMIDFSEPNKIKIKDKLTGWNFLTGLIAMSLKNAMIYNFIGGIIVGILLMSAQIQNSEINFIPFYLVFMLWVLLFSGYYLIKLENFKSQIMALTP
ncbi:hypothetical protein [Kaistella polysaccharea]|uniref:hypothetical protein n=1 Tax=Kaistella polysaccharea TaxID=2878534 RepID=UPI001CF50724|nr:hypothetical protein [Kaistella polysaccharea]